MSSAPKNKSKLSERVPEPSRRPLRLSFSLGSMLVIMVVVAFLGAILSQLFNSLVNPSAGNVGYFALAAAAAPSAILIVAGTVFKGLRWLKKIQAEAIVNSDL